jgi:hypothetical protein
MIAAADNGAVYVARREVGDVIKLVDADRDGVAEQQEVIANRTGCMALQLMAIQFTWLR